MRREILLLAIALLVVAGVVTFAVAIDGSDRFTERQAAATVERALKRCDHDADIGAIRCSDVGDGFVCRAGGGLIATFDEPSPDQPEFEVMC